MAGLKKRVRISDTLDGANQKLFGVAFEHAPLRTRFSSELAQTRKIVEGQNQHLRIREELADVARSLESAQQRHGHIHDHDVGVKFLGALDRLAAVGSLTADFPISLGRKHGSNRTPYVRLIVHQKYSQMPVRHTFTRCADERWGSGRARYLLGMSTLQLQQTKSAPKAEYL